MKLYSVIYGSHDPFGLFEKVEVVNHPKQCTEFGAILLHGGADISPSIYKQRPNKYCHAEPVPSHRDAVEMAFVKHAIEYGMPIIGICRGAQLLCAMDGGHLAQHIKGHIGGGHLIIDKYRGVRVRSNSAHHQMMVPREGNEVIAVSDHPVVGYMEHEKEQYFEAVPEVVHFKQMRGIGIQGHPEWCDEKSAFVQYCSEIIKEKIL